MRYTVDGRVYEVEYKGGHWKAKYKDGEGVRIVYNKDDVEDIHIPDDVMQDVGLIIFIFVGLALLGAGIYGLL